MHDIGKMAKIVMEKRSSKGESLSGPTPMNSEKVMKSDGSEDGRHVAAQDLMSAMNEKSPQKLMEALSNFIDLHGAQAPKE